MKMKKNNNKYHKSGLKVAILWNVLILGIYSISCLVQGVPFSENIEVDTWTGFIICYILTTLAWYYIGYALHKEYSKRKATYLSFYGNLDRKKVDKLFNLYFFRRYAKILTIVAGTAIPWYIIANIGEELQTRHIVSISIIIVAAVTLLYTVKALTDQIRKYK